MDLIMSVFDIGSPPALFAAVAAGAFIKYLASYRISQRNKLSCHLVGKVAAIWIYPIKSCKGICLKEADCTALGIKWNQLTDRHWMVATDDGIFLTQRQEPTMSLIESCVIGDQLQLKAPGMEPVAFPVCPAVTNNNLSKVSIRTDTVTSVDCGNEVADWLCDYLKRPGLRLHFSAPSLEKRESCKIKKPWETAVKPGDKCAFSDYSCYMVLSKASLEDLNERLDKPVPPTNFRANIIVENCEAYAEENWSSLHIGDARLRALDECTRCIMTTVDQSTGVKDKDEQPLATLKQYRVKSQYAQKPCFGVNFALDCPGTIKIGDPVYAKFL